MIDISKYMIIEKSLEALSLAVHPQDRTIPALTPFGKVEVSLRNFERSSTKNPSGYYVFFTLEDGDYTLGIDADYYLTKEFDVTLPDHGLPPGGEIELDDEVRLVELNGGLLAEVALIPAVNYPFPTGATLVRGNVEDNAGNPVPTAMVEVLGSEAIPPGRDISFRINSKAQFVLYCNRIDKNNIVEINGKAYGGGKTLILQAHDDTLGDSPKVETEVHDGETVFQKITFN